MCHQYAGMAMALVKTQIYLTPRQHRELSREARRQRISLAELLRRLADGFLDRPPVPRPTLRAVRGIMKLGRSGVKTTSQDHHRALDELLVGRAVR